MISSQHTHNHRNAFTLIELLTVIAIVGILTAILIPTVGRVQETARRTVDQSNIRQIGQASLLFANENDSRLPTVDLDYTVGTPPAAGGYRLTGGTGTSIHDIAAALAITGGLNDATMWVSRSDVNLTNLPTTPGPVVNTSRNFADGFDGSQLSVDYIAGLSTSYQPSTPIAFTRGLLPASGMWSEDGVYQQDGGHIVFLGGNVSFFRDLGAGAADGRLVNADDGLPTEDITEAMPARTRIYGSDADVGSLNNTDSAHGVFGGT